MGRINGRKFGNDYYRVIEDGLPEKPTWEDDIDLEDTEIEADTSLHGEDAAEHGSQKWKTKRDYEKEKREHKKCVKETRKEVELFVDTNIHFDEEVWHSISREIVI